MACPDAHILALSAVSMPTLPPWLCDLRLLRTEGRDFIRQCVARLKANNKPGWPVPALIRIFHKAVLIRHKAHRHQAICIPESLPSIAASVYCSLCDIRDVFYRTRFSFKPGDGL